MLEEGVPTKDGFMEGRPEVLPWCADLYQMFYECDRDFNGNVTFQGMNAVFEHYGLTDPLEQQRTRTLFRRMNSEARKRGDQVRESK